MGFFNISMEKNILLHPAHFGPRMREILYERLRSEARAAAAALRITHCASLSRMAASRHGHPLAAR